MRILITGGAGFIGTNLTIYFKERGHEVVILDNLVRDGSKINFRMLSEKYPEIEFSNIDVQDIYPAFLNMHDIDAVVHCAAQAAVTHSLESPLDDFDTNAYGSLRLLEACRLARRPPIVIYLSTNKVYGSLDIGLHTDDLRYCLTDQREWNHMQEDLDPSTPYGCSKAVGEIYAKDYHRIYGLATVVFRMSCIYGENQHGTTNQGWVAHFIKAAKEGKEITVYGNGLQVRDLLHVDDLCSAINLAILTIHNTSGKVYNMGGGLENSMSVNELLDWIGDTEDTSVTYDKDFRPSDQKWYVSNTSAFMDDTGWMWNVGIKRGLARLRDWIYGKEVEPKETTKSVTIGL